MSTRQTVTVWYPMDDEVQVWENVMDALVDKVGVLTFTDPITNRFTLFANIPYRITSQELGR